MQERIKLQKKSLGIDIADHTLTLCELEKRGPRISIAGFVQERIPLGVVTRGRINDEEKLHEIVERALGKTKQNSARIGVYGIPESQVYVHIFTSTGEHSADEIKDLSLEEALKTFPIDQQDMLMVQKVMRQDAKGSDILLLATRQEVVLEWRAFFTKTGISVPIFDSEILALYRGLNLPRDPTAVCLVDMGAVSNTVAVFDATGILRYLYTFEGAGDLLTERISKAASVSLDEAENVKTSLDCTQPPAHLVTVVPAFFDHVCNEIKTGIEYAHTSMGIRQSDIQIMLVGGTAKMKGVGEYFKSQLGSDVLVGHARELSGYDHLGGQGIEAIGLALRLLEKNHLDKDPYFISPQVHDILSIPENARKNTGTQFAALSLERPKEFFDILREKKHFKRQVIVLIAVLAVGVVLLIGALWYQQQYQQQKERFLHESVIPMSHGQKS